MTDEYERQRAYFDEITKELPLRREMQFLRERIADLSVGRLLRSQMFIGPHGCGKGFVVVEALKASGQEAIVLDSVTAKELPYKLSQGSRERRLVVIDDSDTLLKDEASLQVLNKALGGKEDGFARVSSASTMRTEDVFDFAETRVVILTNTDFLDPAVVGKKTAEVWKKLQRRIQIRNVLDTSHADRFKYTCYQVVVERALRRGNVHPRIVNTALEFMTENLQCLEDPSLGGLKNVIEAIGLYPDQWRHMLLGKAIYVKSDLSLMPKLVPAPRLIVAQKVCQTDVVFSSPETELVSKSVEHHVLIRDKCASVSGSERGRVVAPGKARKPFGFTRGDGQTLDKEMEHQIVASVGNQWRDAFGDALPARSYAHEQVSKRIAQVVRQTFCLSRLGPRMVEKIVTQVHGSS